MSYEEIYYRIKEEADKLCKSIEEFTVMDNDEYIQSYKEDLREVHSTILSNIRN